MKTRKNRIGGKRGKRGKRGKHTRAKSKKGSGR